tara:strand:+ start:7197 stop:7433 length:237 start_codon:yes stop_codon:yes gene_type:complete
MLLTTGRQFSDYLTAADYDGYIERLALQGIHAVGFGTELVRSGTPDALTEACQRLDIALLSGPLSEEWARVFLRRLVF